MNTIPAFPSKIESYKIEKIIGYGTYALVYEAIDPENQRVAIKVMELTS
jgi:serine/threonine protein kinase